jgi:hypothetical protein
MAGGMLVGSRKLTSRGIRVNAINELILDLSETSEDSENTAIWKSKDGDHSVTVIGDLGIGPDGRHYVSVRNTLTGLPLDELEL